MDKKLLLIPVVAVVGWFSYLYVNSTAPVELADKPQTANSLTEKERAELKRQIVRVPSEQEKSVVASLDADARKRYDALIKDNERFVRYMEEGYGSFEPVDMLNPTDQLKSVIEAIKNPGLYPERLSANAAIPDFDEHAYLADPKAYAAKHVPARAWQSAQPDSGAEPLERISPYYVKTLQGQSVQLSVRLNRPGMPVTFTAVSGGSFSQSRLMSITTITGADGIATVDFTAGSGVIEDCPIFCSSPVALRTMRFVVDARLPAKIAEK